MAEEGIDISAETPKILTTEAVRASDVVITMGCGDACPIFPGSATRTGSWRIPPARASTAVRRVRDDIRGRVEILISELLPAAVSPS